MYLKEAFRYQNFLSNIMSVALTYARDSQYNKKTIQEHLRSKANPDAENEVVDLSLTRPLPYNAGQFASFAAFILEEKIKLTQAISKAKKDYGIDIDAEISISRLRQQLVTSFNQLSQVKPTERITKAYAYKFNAEGNQVQYAYDLREVSEPDFDKASIRAFTKSLVGEIDNTSALVDKANIEIQVDYEPEYDVNDSFEEFMEAFLSKEKN